MTCRLNKLETLKFEFCLDLLLCGWLGSKQQLTKFSGCIILRRHCVVESMLSDCREEFPGQVVRICHKIAKKCCLFLNICSCVKNIFHMFFTFKPKMHVRCVNQQKTGGGNYFWTADAAWVHRYLRFEPSAWIWNEGLPCLSADCKMLIDFV